MSEIRITFSTNNADFRNDGDESLNTNAVADLLRNLADRVGNRVPEIGETQEDRIRDRNGNTIGYLTIEEGWC